MKTSLSQDNLTVPPINCDKKINYINAAAMLSNVDERSHEESRLGGQSSMFGD